MLKVPEGDEKPYQCSGGFYLRVGANCQKLRAVEIRTLLRHQPSFFDARPNQKAEFGQAFSPTTFLRYCNEAQIPNRTPETILENIGAAEKQKDGSCLLTNAGALLFTNSPRQYIPESYVTAVRYLGTDRFSIVDRQEIAGDLLQQIDDTLVFVRRHIGVSYEISGEARRTEHYEYPMIAVREALVNALIHRDYSFQNSCTYLSIYSDRLEIENPGGVFGGTSLEEIEGKSIRRNPILSDLLYRAGYGEKLGSGLLRIKKALADNQNPPYSATSTNFFSIRFLPRISKTQNLNITPRQLQILSILQTNRLIMSASELATHLVVSATTVTRDIKTLLNLKLIQRHGTGKSTRYTAVK